MVLCTQCQRLQVDVESRVRDCSVLEGGRCLLCKEYMELEQQIQDLQERCRKLVTKMNANHDPFILKLPPEVASHIFILFQGPGKSDKHRLGGRRANVSAAFLLGAVCKGWCQLAWSTPQFWSTLAFVLPNPKIMDTLPHLVVDWLERSGGLPLTLDISYLISYLPIALEEGLVSIINAVNQHSRRWHDIRFILPLPYLGRLCGSTPPADLCYLSIHNTVRSHRNTDVKFKMNTRPSPTKFMVSAIPWKAIDISWDRLVWLEVCETSPDVLQVIRDATLLETCILTEISPWPRIDEFPASETIIHHPHLRTLKLGDGNIHVFTKIINSLELPSLESWTVYLEGNLIGVDAISFLKRCGSGLKTLDLWQEVAPTFEDFEQLLQAAPHLQCLLVGGTGLLLIMDIILERISTSASSASQIGNHADFLPPRLQHLELRGEELNAWECIPLIFRWPHRKLLRLDIHMELITISDKVSSVLVQTVDEGIDLRIFLDGKDYLQTFRDSTALMTDPVL